jgi:electron transfer flavoprotein alpha/beta subunit
MLRVAVVVEHVWDPATVEVSPAGELDWSRVVAAPGPGSLEAVELGLGLGAVTAFGFGVGDVPGLLRRCLAMGAVGVKQAADIHAIAVAMRTEGFDLVLAAHRSGDGGPGPSGPLLAGLLDLPQATAVESLRIEGREALATRRLDNGEREDVALPLPAVVAVEPGLVRSRLASPRALVAALGAEVPSLAEVSAAPRPVFLGYAAPRPAPPRLRTPDPDQPAEARIATVVGGPAGGGQRHIVSGDPEAVARRILELLRDRGFVA